MSETTTTSPDWFDVDMEKDESDQDPVTEAPGALILLRPSLSSNTLRFQSFSRAELGLTPLRSRAVLPEEGAVNGR